VVALASALVASVFGMNSRVERPPTGDFDRSSLVAVIASGSPGSATDWRTLNAGGLQRLQGYGSFQDVAGQVLTSGVHRRHLPRVFLPGHREPLEVAVVTSNYFDVVGRPEVGRGFSPEHDEDGAEAVAVISSVLWKEAFARRPDIVGHVLDGPSGPLCIVGVAPLGFRGVRRGDRIDLWVPGGLLRDMTATGHGFQEAPLIAVARLHRTATARSALRELESDRMFASGGRTAFRVVTVEQVVGSASHATQAVTRNALLRFLLPLMGVVGFFTALPLAVTCLARCRIYGGRRGRIGFAALLFVLGSITVSELLYWTTPRPLLSGGVDLSRIDLRVGILELLYVCATFAAFATIARGVWPRMRQVLGVRAPVSMTGAVIMAIGAGLLLSLAWWTHSLKRGAVDELGFSPERVVFIEADVPRGGNSDGRIGRAESPADATDRASRLRELLEALRGDDRIDSVAIGGSPIGRIQNERLRMRADAAAGVGLSRHPVASLRVGTGYFDTIGVSVLREFPIDAGLSDQRPIFISKSLADSAFSADTRQARELQGRTAGVVADIAYGTLRVPRDRHHIVYQLIDVVAAAGLDEISLTVRVRTETAMEGVSVSLEETVRRAFPEATDVRVKTGRAVVAEDLAEEHFALWWLRALVSLVVLTGGAYAMVAGVSERRHGSGGGGIGRGIRAVRNFADVPTLIGGACGIGLTVLSMPVLARLLGEGQGVARWLGPPPLFALIISSVTVVAVALLRRHVTRQPGRKLV
jgi:hypothetical protein